MMQYHLKRIGKAATVFGVKDVLKLTKEITKFGRHSQNDHFLDSAEYMCLISRWHSEIHRLYEDGKLRFVLKDNGLNGTFVNDVRVDGSVVIEVGDVITFGHPNGKKIKPGEKAVQTDSEFCFLFEKLSGDLLDEVLPDTNIKPDIATEYIPPDNNNYKAKPVLHHKTLSHQYQFKTEAPVCVSDIPQPVYSVGVSPTVGDMAVLGDQDTVVQPHQQAQAEPGLLHTGNTLRMGSTSKLGQDHIGHSTFILKDISNKNSSQGLVHLDELFANHHKVSPPHQEAFALHTTSESEKFTVTSTSDSGVVESDEDIFKSTGHSSTLDYLNTQEASTSQKLPATISQLQMHLQKPSLPASVYPPLSSILDKPSQLTTTESSITISDAGLGRKLKGTRRASSGRKRSISVHSEDPDENDGMKKKRRKSNAKTARTDLSMNYTVDHSNEEELPTFHYDGDRCDSYDCCQPLSSTVSWVQCDDCDKWYHTACAGASYDEVRQNNAEFHCGCTR